MQRYDDYTAIYWAVLYVSRCSFYFPVLAYRSIETLEERSVTLHRGLIFIIFLFLTRVFIEPHHLGRGRFSYRLNAWGFIIITSITLQAGLNASLNLALFILCQKSRERNGLNGLMQAFLGAVDSAAFNLKAHLRATSREVIGAS